MIACARAMGGMPDWTARFRRFEFMAKIATFGEKHQLPAMQGRTPIKTAHADNKNNVLMRVRSGETSHYVAVPLGNG
jgi:hypothetical protein